MKPLPTRLVLTSTAAASSSADLSRLVSAEHTYGKAHHKAGTKVAHYPGRSIKVSGVKIKARPTQFVVDPSTRRDAAGFMRGNLRQQRP